jgi:hypothetical protein
MYIYKAQGERVHINASCFDNEQDILRSLVLRALQVNPYIQLDGYWQQKFL